jgi:phage-related minor tail protein
MGLPTGINGYAKGDVFNSSNLSGYSNSIVKQPTFFAFASGGGVMGEAGPEAIMPLTRASDGSLGVRSVGSNAAGGTGGASQVYVNVGGVVIQSQQQQPNSANQIDISGINKQMKSAIISTVSEQAQKPGTPLWNAIKGRGK